MTDREKAIVMAHTGICMLAGEKFGVFHAYIEDIMGRPVYTHELAIQSISDEIKEKSRDDFIKLCKEEQETCEDAIRREDAIDAVSEALEHVVVENEDVARKMMNKLPSVNAQPKIGHCKGCKYFEYDSVAKVDGIPLIVAHEICSRWGDGCKTKEDGYCFLYEPRERSGEE